MTTFEWPAQVFADHTSFDILYRKFGESWRIEQNASLFDYAPGQTTETFTDRSFPDKPVEAKDLPNRATAEAICRRAGVSDLTALEACILDVALTGEVAFARAAMRTQQLLAGASGAATLNVTASTRRGAAPLLAARSDLRPVAEGGPPKASDSVAGIVVQGTGSTEYTVLDAAGKTRLGQARTRELLPLAPGHYIVDVNGSRRAVTLGAGQQVSVPTGSVVVSASEGVDYTVSTEQSDGYLAWRMVNTPIELLPGAYVAAINGSRRSVTIGEGQRVSATVGSVIVLGAGLDDYTVSEASSNRYLTYRKTNAPMDVFPGNYVVAVNGSAQSVTVREGQRTSVTAGSVVVEGLGTDDYTVTEASSQKYLTYRQTNRLLEVLAGEYVVGLSGSSQSVSVRAGQKTALRGPEPSCCVCRRTTTRTSCTDASGTKYFGRVPASRALFEMLPGSYVVVSKSLGRRTVRVSADQRTTVQ